MKKGNLIIICLMAFLMLMMVGYFVGAGNINPEEEPSMNITTNFNENDADLPIWNIGDSWTYHMETEGEQNQYFSMDFDFDINNMEFEVVEVQDDFYKLSIVVPQGDFNGKASVDLGGFTFSGTLEDAYMNGFLYVKKSTFEVNKIEGTIEGDTNKIILPHFNIDFQLEFEIEENYQAVKTNFSSLRFPINIDDTWSISLTYLNMSFNAHQPNLGQNRLYSYVSEHEVKCMGWGIVTRGDNDYDALKISGITYGDKSDIWYSPAIGNIIKVDYKNVELGFGYLLKKFTMDLLSTTYQSLSNPPVIPSIPDGPTNKITGEMGDYETVSTDPDGNKIRYIFEWGDGSENAYTDFVNSGVTVTASHTWTKKGNYEVRVKARDKYGWESEWSDPLSVIVINNKPSKPSKPDGAINGEIKKSYPYTTSAYDPDGHKVRFGFDWDGDNQVDDWTEFVDSNETATKSHTWYNKGSYGIKVKAQDEYGEESDWSDPLSVSIPKYKFVNNLFLKFFEKHPLIFSVLIYIQRIMED